MALSTSDFWMMQFLLIKIIFGVKQSFHKNSPIAVGCLPWCMHIPTVRYHPFLMGHKSVLIMEILGVQILIWD